ncbi:GDSL-motif lipase/hydrolase family protein [Heracleum sosnowskyi]|uniref:GDSL-motif lipase/hydrolase family protein n=1 Tax=Heracleum sosnowskyi TaxID=360622 RepID=A0AAD8MJX9_9APIA|nr:GDSL-motif lipase/hydrolase family protein [Heracleum sosnowskyi]
MRFLDRYTHPLVVVVVESLLILISSAVVLTETRKEASFPAIFVFGDSTVDPGNNNYIGTPFKSDFPPYGIDFANHIPTGRFTNGRLVTDFIASYVGIKENVPPYLDPTLSLEELMTGVSFASAGSGFDPLTATLTQVIPVIKQVDLFKEYVRKMEVAVGKERAGELIKNALFVISAGTNDYVLNYYGPPIRSQTYTISAYHQFLVQIVQQFLQDLVDLGARKILMGGVPPIECLPVVITLNSLHSDAFRKRNCIDSLSSVAPDHNQLLRQKLKDMQPTTDLHLVYADIHKPFRNILQNTKRFGFEDANSGCCGTGLLETSFLCNPDSPICSDASTYVFFDSVHPTERAYHIVFQDIIPAIDLLINS